MQSPKNIVIFGAGALGGKISVYLTRAGHNVLIVSRWKELVEKVRKDGYTIVTHEGEITQQVNIALHDESHKLPETIDIVIICVKTHDSELVARYCLPFLQTDTWVLTAQNGLREDLIAPIVGVERCVGLITLDSVGAVGLGKIQLTNAHGKGFVIGELDGRVTPRVEQLKDLLSAVAETRITNNFYGESWSKLNVNCVGSTTCAISGLTTHQVFSHPQAVGIHAHIAGEVVKVATALGIKLPDPFFFGLSPSVYLRAYDGDKDALQQIKQTILNFRLSGSPVTPSMLQDIQKNRKTEIDDLNGYVVYKGQELGIDTVANKAIIGVIKKMEAGEIGPTADNFQLLQQFAT